MKAPEFVPNLPFRFNPGVARDRSLMITPSFVGPFCMSVGAQSTAQSWHIDPLAHYEPLNLLIVAQRTLAL